MTGSLLSEISSLKYVIHDYSLYSWAKKCGSSFKEVIDSSCSTHG